VLEIGTGSGYATAVLGEIASEVYTVERLARLAESAGRRLSELRYTNVHVRHGDGSLGWAEHAPYDAIVVTAGGPQVPQSLLAQLSVGWSPGDAGGVDPAGAAAAARGACRRGYLREDLGDVAFVPLIGAEGWPHTASVEVMELERTRR
jgi:protein-L-isoaspartate(D-aspartate) O-methyltransferase